MARLTESQLAGFRTGTTTKPDRSTRPARGRGRPPEEPGSDQASLVLNDGVTSTGTALGPVPPAPARSDTRHKVGLTLPIELAEAVRGVTGQGYALADVVMVAYQHHRDELVRERRAATARRLQRRAIGRCSLTVTLSAAERDALDALARQIDNNRSHTVAALLQRHLSHPQTETAAAAESPEQRSSA